jgi:hypothetical protein
VTNNVDTLLRVDTIEVDTSLKVVGLPKPSRNYWQVMAFNQGGASQFSAVDSFTLIVWAPPAPTLCVSADQKYLLLGPKKFTWYSAPTATRYHMQIAVGLNFKVSDIIVDTFTVDTAIAILDTLVEYTTYSWRVAAGNIGGSSAYSTALFTTGGPDGISGVGNEIPKEIALLQNFPNPFNPTTTIEYALPRNGHARIDIYDLLGRRIRTLVDRGEVAGSYKVVWDGKNSGEQSVASGVYFYAFVVDGILKEMKRSILLK